MVRIFMTMKAADQNQWFRVDEVALASQVNAGTAGRHLCYLADHGVLDREKKMHPAYYYQYKPDSAAQNEIAQELQRLAAEFSDD